jgi:hypothetical protein
LTGPEALPLAGVTEIQPAALDAVHVQPDGAVTPIAPLPPPLGALRLVADSVGVHCEAAACVTVTFCPSMTSVAVRLEAVEFAEADTLIAPLPLTVPVSTVSQDAELLPDHVQPLDVATLTLFEPPDAENDSALVFSA